MKSWKYVVVQIPALLLLLYGLARAGVMTWSLTDAVLKVESDGVELLTGDGYYPYGVCAVNTGEVYLPSGTVDDAPGDPCQGADFTITITQTGPNTLHSKVEIGPLEVNYSSLQMRLDLLTAGSIKRKLRLAKPPGKLKVKGKRSRVSFGAVAAGKVVVLEEDLIVN